MCYKTSFRPTIVLLRPGFCRSSALFTCTFKYIPVELCTNLSLLSMHLSLLTFKPRILLHFIIFESPAPLDLGSIPSGTGDFFAVDRVKTSFLPPDEHPS